MLIILLVGSGACNSYFLLGPRGKLRESNGQVRFVAFHFCLFLHSLIESSGVCSFFGVTGQDEHVTTGCFYDSTINTRNPAKTSLMKNPSKYKCCLSLFGIAWHG